MTDFQSLTDDDLSDIIWNAKKEMARRSSEPKLPVFAVDGTYYKCLKEALKNLSEDITHILAFKGGNPEEYFGEMLTDGVDRTRLGLRIVFWSKSEYDNRPDRVYGAPYD